MSNEYKAMSNTVNLAVLLSGSGRTLQNFIDRIQDGSLNARIRIVISSEPDAYGLERAKKYNIPTAIVRFDDFKDDNSFSEAITEQIEKHSVDLITMAGFIRFYRIPDKYLGRVMNIHPGLIPAFSAGSPGLTDDTRTPLASLRPKDFASSGVNS